MISLNSIRRCPDLTAVSRLIARDKRYAMAMRRLRRTKTKEHHFVLSAPATVALAIDESGMDWPIDRPLRLALLATSTYEFLDDGQWLRFVPPMLPGSGVLEVFAFGRKSETARTSTVSKILNRRYDVSARWSEKSLCENPEIEPFDIAISFSGITGTPRLLDDLIALRASGTPLYLTSFSSTQALLTHAVLRAHGAEADAVLARNPFGLVSKRVGENWNRVISKVPVDALPKPGTQVDPDYLNSLQVVAAMVYQSHTLGDPSQTWPIGGSVEPGLVHTLDGIAVNVETREVIDLNARQTLGALGERFTEAVQTFSDNWDETDKLVWASTIRFLAMEEGMTGGGYPGGAAA